MSSFVDISIKEDESVVFEDSPLTQQSRHSTNSYSSSDESTSSTIINGKYLIDRVIGRGAFGTVNLATDVKNPNIQYAIKYVHCIDHNAINSAMNEVWSLRNLQHDNLVKFETVFVHSGMNSLSGMEDLFVCFVMPFYELGDLDVYVRKVRMD
jgi:serine/threonine protein kinase